MNTILQDRFRFDAINNDDYMEQEERDEKALLCLKRRLKLYNRFGNVLNPKFESVTIDNIKISLNEESISKWILKNNDDIDRIRDHMITHGTKSQRRILTEKINYLGE